jgi:hypothetical protein
VSPVRRRWQIRPRGQAQTALHWRQHHTMVGVEHRPAQRSATLVVAVVSPLGEKRQPVAQSAGVRLGPGAERQDGCLGLQRPVTGLNAPAQSRLLQAVGVAFGDPATTLHEQCGIVFHQRSRIGNGPGIPPMDGARRRFAQAGLQLDQGRSVQCGPIQSMGLCDLGGMAQRCLQQGGLAVQLQPAFLAHQVLRTAAAISGSCSAMQCAISRA